MLEVILGDGFIDGDRVTRAGFQFHPALGIGVKFLDVGTVFTGVVGCFGTDLSADGLTGDGVIAGDVRIARRDDDGVAALVVDVSEVDLFLPFIRSVHAGSDEVNLAALQGRDEGIEAEVLDFHLVAQFVADGLGQVDVETDVFFVFREFKGRERRFRADDEGLVTFGSTVFFVGCTIRAAAGEKGQGCQGGSDEGRNFFLHHNRFLH